MKLIIDIPNKIYNALTHTEFDANLVVDEMRKSIIHGTPIPDNATVCDIEQIRDEIEAARYGLINDGLDVALRIIDKYTKGE